MSARFVTTLRARATPLRLVPDDAAPMWTLRVQSAEAWDAVRVEVLPTTLVREIKRAAMTSLLPDIDALDAYVVKIGGFEVQDEGLAVERAGALDGSTLLIMARRRRPVR